MTCPHCGSNDEPTPVRIHAATLPVLGIYGAKLFHVAKCPACGKRYDGKNGTLLGKRIFLTYAITVLAALVFVYGALKHWY